MLSGREKVSRSTTRQAGTDGDAVAQRLRQRHDIGRDARMLMTEPGAGAAQPGLDLVEHQQPAVPVAQGPQPPQVFGAGRTNAAFALYRLDQHRNDIGRLRCRTADRLDIVVRHAQKAR